MPFDGKTFNLAEPAVPFAIQGIREIREIVAAPETWCKHSYQSGAAFCLLGAQSEVDRRADLSRKPWERQIRWAAVSRALDDALPKFVSVEPTGIKNFITFNDAPTTSHADILALLDRAEARLTNEYLAKQS